MMDFESYVSCVIGIMLVMHSKNANTFSINPECGETKGCYSDCDHGQSCTFSISWLSGKTSTEFTIQATLSTNTDHYVCVGLSSTQTMDDASVSSCLMTNSGSFSYENSYNDGHHNILVTNPTNGLSDLVHFYANNIINCTFKRTNSNTDAKVFDLTTNFYMMFAQGKTSGGKKLKHDKYSLSSQKVDLKSVAEVGQGEPSRIKAHGSIAIIAWMCFMNIGNIIVRYFKPLWSSKHIFGSAVWFQVHRLLMSIGAVLTITSICVIIRGSLKIGDTRFENAHPIMGITILCLVIINPILGILRPDMDSKYRPVFFCAHYIVGLGSLILGPVNIFIGIQLKKANVTRTAFYFLIVHEVLKCLMIVILEVLLIKEKNIVKQEEKYRLNSNEMHKIQRDNKSSPQNIDDNRPPYAWKVRKILLSVHVFIALTFTLGMVILVTTSTSS
ncbi:ferric-chelate reductase 1-like [Mytilus californianus]|uniref:ferric-chelate reductase 1-like n=1 Tax=Mytilus californianus TaxID=6549 RepID=UPI002247B18F|nr:ferric-chelate reductase 1-like [Mytilus californianus]